MDVFEGLLLELHSSCEDPLKAEGIIRKISNYFRKNENYSSNEALIFLVFGDNGITSFLRKILRFDLHKSNVIRIFSFLEFLLVNYESFCISFADTLKALCFAIIQAHVSARIKENAVKLLKCIFSQPYITTLNLSDTMTTITHLRDKVPVSVQSQLFSLAGIIFERIPEVTGDGSDYLNYFLASLKEDRMTKVNLIFGCLEGINGYMVSFTPNADQISNLYGYLRDFCALRPCYRDFTQRETRKAAESSVLRIMHRHYRYFGERLHVDIQYWHEILHYWLEKVKEDRHLVFNALVSVYKSIAWFYSVPRSTGRGTNLETIVNDLLISRSSLNVASTIGLLEVISTGIVREDISNQILQMVMKRFTPRTDNLMYLALNLECVTKYLGICGTVKTDYLIQIRKMAVTLIEGYPNIQPHFIRFSLEGLEKSFYHMGRCGSHELDEYAKEVIYQGVIRSCTHRMSTYTEMKAEISDEDLKLYKSFLPLWIHLTNLSSSTTFDLDYADSRSVISTKVLDEYISSFLKINRKLDLRFKVKNPYIPYAETTAEASRPNDWIIFINNVNLFVDIMEKIDDLQRVKKWLMTLLSEAIDSIYKAPEISEYYKIVIVCLNMAEKIQFFEESAVNGRAVQKFLWNISRRAGHYKGDAQISCFQTLLAAPARLIEPFLKDMVPVFKMMLKASIGNISLLEDVVSTLERWFTCSQKEDVEFLLKNILPYFDVFLQSTSEAQSVPHLYHRYTKLRELKTCGEMKNIFVDNCDSKLIAIQKKFILFLGSLSTDISKHLIEDKGEDGEGDYHEDDWVKTLTYDLPLMEGNLRICISFLPRVIELALTSEDRYTRVRACEFLHTAVALTLGSSKKRSGELTGLFAKLVPVCLQLASDSDVKIQQIYELLVVQMVHYFSGRDRNVAESEIFIDCLMRSVSHPSDSKLRDLASRLVREFVEWSLQDVTSTGEIGYDVKLIMRSMYSLSVDPNYYKRRGSAIVFNNIFSLINNETELFDTNWFLFYYYFIEGLSMCVFHEDTSHMTNAVELIKASLRDRAVDTSPKLPPGFNENYMGTPMTWIFNRCSHKDAKIRKLSMGFIEEFSKGSLKQFVQTHIGEIFAKKDNIINGQGDANTWLTDCSSLFDYYNWLLEHGVVTGDDLKNIGMDELLNLYIDKITTNLDLSDAVPFDSLATLHMLELLTTATERNIILHNPKILEFVRTCIYRPSKCRFEVYDLEGRQKRLSTLKVLIPKLVPVLKEDEMGRLLSADEYFASLQDLSEQLQDREPLWDLADLVSGLKMVHGLGLWNKRVKQNISGNEILGLVFNSIFAERPSCLGFLIEVHDRVYLADFIRFGIEIGVSVDVIIDILKNREEVIEEETFSRTTKGEYFMNMFKDELFDYFIRNSDTALDKIILQFPNSALITIFNTLNHSIRTDLSYGYKKRFVSELSRRWAKLEELPDSNKVILLSIVRSICQLIPEALVEEYSVRDWFLDVVAATSTLEEVEIVFEMFPYVSNMNEEYNEKIWKTLEQVFKNHGFFAPASNVPDNKVTAVYKGLLNSFLRTRSLTVFQAMTEVVIKYRRLLKVDEIEKVAVILCQSKLYRIPDDHLATILYFLYGKLFTSDSPSDELYELYAVKFLQKSSSDFAWNYLLDFFDDLMAILRRDNIVRRISALKIIQICASKGRRFEYESMSEQKKEVFRNCMTFCSKIPSGEDNELMRKYVCCCFNTLCALVTLKSNDGRLYRSLIFRDNFPFLPRMICLKRRWILKMDFDEIPVRRKVLVALRKSLAAEQQIKLGRAASSIQYLKGDTFFNSSLKDDVTRFDYPNWVFGSADSSPKRDIGEYYIELEIDEINNHECMATLIGIIRYMVEEGITPVDRRTLPFWLSAIMTRLTTSTTSENEKIYLMKLICNIEEYIRPYAELIIYELLYSVLLVFQEEPMNYLIMDMITVIVNWNLDWNVIDGDLDTPLTQLAVYVIKKCTSPRKDIIKNNLEIAKVIVEKWKSKLKLHILSMYACRGVELRAAFPKQHKSIFNYLNIQFCAILLVNSVPAWIDHLEEDFIRALLEYFDDERNGKYAAEVCGLAFKYLKGRNFRNLDKLVKMAKKKVQYIKANHIVNELPLIYGIYKNFPEFSLHFIGTIRNSAWGLRGEFRVQSLEMLLTHLRTVSSVRRTVFGSTIYGFLLDMLSPDDFEALAIALQITEIFLSKPIDCMANEVLQRALTFGDFKIARVRRSVYNIAMNILDNWEERYAGKLPLQIRTMSKVVMLNGINDKEPDLCEKCLEFWYIRTSGTESCTQFGKILCELYTPEAEKGFFNFAAKVMIRSSVHGADFSKNIFEHPLVFGSTFEKKIISSASYWTSDAPSLSVALSGFFEKSKLFKMDGDSWFGGGDKSESQKLIKKLPRYTRKAQKDFTKKRTALGEELDRKKAGSKGDDVELLRDYKVGDYPFIQITHFDVLKPLEDLAMQDSQIGRCFITSIYDGFVANMTDVTKEMIGQIGEFVGKVYEEHSSPDPAISAFLFYVHMNSDRLVKADSSVIAKVAKSSGWLSVGGLVIEDVIIAEEDEVPAVRRTGITNEERAWYNMAELTRSLKEFDILRGILVDKLSVGALTSEAIRCESVSDWFNASASYESALSRGESSLDGFCVEAYSNSLARLSDWSKLNTYIRDTYELDDLWSNPSLFERVLPWFMRSTVIQSDAAKGMAEITEMQEDPEKQIDLKKYFVQELTLSNFLNGNSQWAGYYLHQTCLNFLSNWSHWNKWSNNFRFFKINEFQLMSEVEQCIRVYKGKTNLELSTIANLWSRNSPRESDDLMNWDLKLILRNHFLSTLRNSYPDLDCREVRRSVLVSELDFVKSGIVQKNVRVCEKYLKEIKRELEIENDFELRLMHNYYASCCELLRGELYESDENMRVTRIVNAASGLQGQMAAMMDMEHDSCTNFFYESNMRLSKVMHLLQSYREESLGYAVAVWGLDRSDIIRDIHRRELKYLENAAQVVEGVNEKLLSDAYIKIVKYHIGQEGYNSQLAKCLFRSMSLGNVEARQLFCCLLNDVRLAEEWATDGEIRSCFEAVPVWMFLKWINQLLANLDSEMFPFVRDVLFSVAEAYPNSMRYAFELSKSNFTYNHRYGDECRSFVDALTEKLWLDIQHTNFLTALSFVAAPDLVLKHVIKKLATEVKSPTPNWDNIGGIVQDFYRRAYCEEMKRFRGPVFDCLCRVKSDIEVLLNLGPETTLWQDKILNLVKSMPKYELNDTLKQFSPWLYNYQSTYKDLRIELPGQYTGDHRPILEHHVYISSFKHRVLVMNSKSKPVRISIVGDDAREYAFLVKSGEDLRQDQRIQQIFEQMNHVLRGNGEIFPHSIDTYKVIPLTSNLGIIEWVKNTISLHDVLTKQDPSIKKTLEVVQKSHLEFLAQDTNVGNVTAVYLNGYKNINRDNAVARFTERIYAFKWDLLRKAFWNLSTSPEHYAYMRKNFASSEAVIFIAHWLVGIGDRHLDNTLVSTRTGRALGIDFGCAFGFATEFLTPPELVPFRLTPQIVNLMKPIGTSGLIRGTMVHCLKALCREKAALLAMLEVFASEPAMDWLEKAKRDGTFRDESEWSPRKKIAMVKDKLEGVNPVNIFSADLKSGHSNSECLEKYLEVLRGGESRCTESPLTEEKQVDVLLDLASDYHILSKTYVGWNPWL